jgi:hypothetical protein
LANVLNSYVFARPHSPLTELSIRVEKGHLKVKGKLHDKGEIPFETEGTLSPTEDGKLRLHGEKIDHYKEQLSAGYTKTTMDSGLHVYIKDYNKLHPAEAPPGNDRTK